MEIESAKNCIGNAKTIDSVPVAHAHWIKGAFADITCSNAVDLWYRILNDIDYKTKAESDEVEE